MPDERAKRARRRGGRTDRRQGRWLLLWWETTGTFRLEVSSALEMPIIYGRGRPGYPAFPGLLSGRSPGNDDAYKGQHKAKTLLTEEPGIPSQWEQPSLLSTHTVSKNTHRDTGEHLGRRPRCSLLSNVGSHDRPEG